MKKRISNPADITPAYEDSGLFKKPSTELAINLIPKFGKNTRHDIIIKGLMQNDVEVDVIFAGRRKHQAEELVTLLKRMWDDANQMVIKGTPPPKRRNVRVPTRVQGSWRTRVTDDAQELYTVEHQLLVARWAYHGYSGDFHSFGEPPYVQQRFQEFLKKTRERE